MSASAALPSHFACAAAFLLCHQPLHAQVDTTDVEPATPDRRCLITTGISLGVGTAGTLVLLDRAWYSEHQRAPLHTFDDSGEWLQVDKAGHFFSAYALGSVGHALLDRCGTRRRTSTLIGGSLGLVFLSGVEVLDGTSAQWGFSWTDMAANVAGTGFFIGQQLLWEEQRIHVKFSAHATPYAARRPELLGEGLAERVLKDYNGQTYWLSGNLHRLTGLDLPPWLSFAAGYGARGMMSAHPRPAPDGTPDGRYRQYFLSPDIDLTRIRTRSKFLRTTFFILNAVKIPAPTLEFRSTGKVVGHWIYF